MAGEPRLLDVGVVTKPHGLRGDVVVHAMTDVPERFAVGATFSTDRGILAVTRSSVHGAVPKLAFAGYETREGAEQLRGLVLRAAPVAVDGVVFIHELVGAEIRTVDGRELGTVASVEANPASDLLVTSGGHLIPMVFVVEHQAGAAITVDVPEGLLDL